MTGTAESVDFSGKSSRRKVLSGCAAAAVLALAPRSVLAVQTPPAAARELTFRNLHTDERLSTCYWERGTYVPGALDEIAHVLRDHRSGEIYPIDPALLDLLFTLNRKLETSGSFQVISGYRSPTTNAMLNAKSNGVAKKSLHMQGKAIDVRVAGVELKTLRDAAKSLQMGGVGFYPKSDFVHVDVGRVRFW